MGRGSGREAGEGKEQECLPERLVKQVNANFCC